MTVIDLRLPELRRTLKGVLALQKRSPKPKIYDVYIDLIHATINDLENKYKEK